VQVVTFVKMYAQAQARAVVCNAPMSGNGAGLAFQKDDRTLLAGAMESVKKTPSQLATILEKEIGGTHGMHFHRLSTFKRQVAADKVRMAGGKGVVIAKVFTPVASKVCKEVQATFDHAASQLVKIGITDEVAAQSFLTRAFINVRVAQKLDSKAERIEQELRMGDLDKAQVLEVLSRVQKRF